MWKRAVSSPIAGSYCVGNAWRVFSHSLVLACAAEALVGMGQGGSDGTANDKVNCPTKSGCVTPWTAFRCAGNERSPGHIEWCWAVTDNRRKPRCWDGGGRWVQIPTWAFFFSMSCCCSQSETTCTTSGTWKGHSQKQCRAVRWPRFFTTCSDTFSAW